MHFIILSFLAAFIFTSTKAQIGSGSSSNPEISLFMSTDMSITLDRNSVTDKYGNKTSYNNNIKGSQSYKGPFIVNLRKFSKRFSSI